MYFTKVKALYYLTIINLYLFLDIIFSIDLLSDFVINNIIYCIYYIIK